MYNNLITTTAISTNYSNNLTFSIPTQPTTSTTTAHQQQQQQRIHQMACAFPFVPSYIYTSLILGIVIIVLNAFVFYLFCKKKSLRTLPGNYILASLSVNDFLNGCYVVCKLYPNFYLRYSEGGCHMNQFQFFTIEWPTAWKTVHTLLMLSSVLHLVILSSDRLTYVVRALTYTTIITRSKIIRVLVFAWTLCTVCSCVQLMWSLREGPLNEYRLKFKFYHTIVIGVFFIAIPSGILLVQSMTMVILVLRLGNNSRVGRKAFALYVCMYLTFMVCAYPYIIIMLMFDLKIFRSRIHIPADLIQVFVIMRFVPCLINPCMYSLQNRDYRKVIKTYLRCLKKTTERYQTSRRSGVDHLLVANISRNNTAASDNTRSKETVSSFHL